MEVNTDKTFMLFRSVFFMRVLLMTIVLFIIWTPQLRGQSNDELFFRLEVFLNKTESIRVVFLRIANSLRNEGVQGADKIYDTVFETGNAITMVRDRIGYLKQRFAHNTMSSMRIKAIPITIAGGNVFSENWSINFPEQKDFFPNIPKLSQTLIRFLDLVDQPLSYALQGLHDLENEMNKSLTAVHPTQEYSALSKDFESFPSAEYLFPKKIRDWLGNPVVVIAVNVAANIFENFHKITVDIGDQDISILGEGGCGIVYLAEQQNCTIETAWHHQPDQNDG